MGRDDKHAAPGVPESDDDFDDAESHAADEPTAVWDESALRAAGLGDIFKRREPDAPSPAATPSVVPDAPSIVVEEGVAPDASAALPRAPSAAAVAPTPVPPAPAGASGGLSWPTTVGIALALGGAAYLLIRFLKG